MKKILVISNSQDCHVVKMVDVLTNTVLSKIGKSLSQGFNNTGAATRASILDARVKQKSQANGSDRRNTN